MRDRGEVLRERLHFNEWHIVEMMRKLTCAEGGEGTPLFCVLCMILGIMNEVVKGDPTLSDIP